MSSQKVSIYLTSNTRNVISGLNGKNKDEIKKELKSKLSEMLSNGEITKQEMKAAIKYCDKDLQLALAGKNLYEHSKGFYGQLKEFYGEDEAVPINGRVNKLFEETGLSVDDLYVASRLAGPDFTINTVDLSKEENMNFEGEFTPSELVNIQNELNSKIKANGGDKVLTQRETIRLMQAIGLKDGTKKASIGLVSLAGFIVPFNIINAIVMWSSDAEKSLITRKIKEKPFDNQDNKLFGSVINKTEAKMNELFPVSEEIDPELKED